jgi:hypothetical protein
LPPARFAVRWPCLVKYTFGYEILGRMDTLNLCAFTL